MYDPSGELTVILITFWWLKRLGNIGGKSTSITEFWCGEI